MMQRACSTGETQNPLVTEEAKQPCVCVCETHLVTLKILSSRRALNTLMPNDVPGLMTAYITSNILPTIT